MSRTLTPEARAKIIEAVKLRWGAAREKAAGIGKKAKGKEQMANGKANGKKSHGAALPGSRLTKATREKESVGRLKAAAPVAPVGNVMNLDPKTCRRSPWNRDEFDDEKMAKMTVNVGVNGVLQNGIVRKNPGTAVTFGDGKWIVRSKG